MAVSSGFRFDAYSSSIARISSKRTVTASSMLLLSFADVPNLFGKIKKETGGFSKEDRVE